MPVPSPLPRKPDPKLPAPRFALATVFLAFAVLGFFGAMAGAMVPAVQIIFNLGLSAAIVVQWIGMVGCGLASLPLARAQARLGPARLMTAGLAASTLGCLAVCLAMQVEAKATGGYAGLLAALLLLAVGATALQVAINPLALALGEPATGAARLTLAQGLNSLGVLAGVNLAAALALGRAGSTTPALLATGVTRSYLAAAIATAGVLLLALLMRPSPARAPAARANAEKSALRSALHCRWAIAGAAAIALYVGVEGAIGGIMTGFLHQDHILGVSLATAGRYLANVYWGGALVGRFAGAGLLRRYPATRLLSIAAGGAAACCAVAAAASGPPAAAAALGIGLCNAVMFPLIFAITLERSTAAPAAVSGLLVLATSGGALVSMAVGLVGERISLSAAFLVPLVAYCGIAGFAARAGLWKASA